MIRSALVATLVACGTETPPEFPADYAATYTEVRNCRSSSDHDLRRVRMLADPVALEPYNARTEPIPAGAVVLKEEFDFADTACAGPIIQWTVMQRLATDDDLGWRWQRVDPDRSIVTENDERCINCHTACGKPPDGFDGTCAMP